MNLMRQDLISGMNSSFWEFFKSELEILQKEQMAILTKLENSIDLHRCQGRIEVLQDIINWPEIQLENVDADIEFDKKQKEVRKNG